VLHSLTVISFSYLNDSRLKPQFIVLSSRKDGIQDKKGKDYEITKWDADLRKSLAHKKASAAALLTKEEQVLVRAQLEKETLIRQHVAAVKANLERGLHFIRSLPIVATTHAYRSYISPMVALLLDGALKKGSTLVDQRAFDAYLVSNPCIFGHMRLIRACRSFLNAARNAWMPSGSGLGSRLLGV
jgi:hypothetical protein